MDQLIFSHHSSRVQKNVHTTSKGENYATLVFVCPGCQTFGSSGLHMLFVNTSVKSPAWTWNGNLEKPTLNPSIMSSRGTSEQCHSFLTDGVFRFLEDCAHTLAGQHVEMPDLPSWFLEK